MRYIWNSYEFRMIWTPSELHKNYMTSAQEVPLNYTWIWFLVSLLCTSYEWASRSVVVKWYPEDGNYPGIYDFFSSRFIIACVWSDRLMKQLNEVLKISTGKMSKYVAPPLQLPHARSHYNDVLMSAMSSQMTSPTIAYSTIYSKCRSKKTSKLRLTGLCEGNSPVTGEIHTHKGPVTRNNVSIWRHHVYRILALVSLPPAHQVYRAVYWP